uniref:Gamma-tubulin complex component n=1 Tax=Glossina brevipalpis TaxID=37001 RepID=A0A1A9WGL1_9MUSC
MTHVLQSMGDQLDKKINQCQNLQDMKMVHKSYLSTVCEHCFLIDNLNAIKFGVEQLLNLTCILNLEWLHCTGYIESKYPLSVDHNDSCSNDSSFIYDDYIENTQIDAIELTYIRCHQYLANKLNNEWGNEIEMIFPLSWPQTNARMSLTKICSIETIKTTKMFQVFHACCRIQEAANHTQKAKKKITRIIKVL